MAPNAPECSDPAHQHFSLFQVDDSVLIQALDIQALESRVRSLTRWLLTSEKEKSMLHDPVHPLDKANEAKLEEIEKKVRQLDCKIQDLSNDCRFQNESIPQMRKLHISIQRALGKEHIKDLEFCVRRLKALPVTQAEIEGLISEMEERYEHAIWLHRDRSEDFDDEEYDEEEEVMRTRRYWPANDDFELDEQHMVPLTPVEVSPPPESAFDKLLRNIAELIEEAPSLRAGARKIQEENLTLHEEVEKLKSDCLTVLHQKEDRKLQEELKQSSAEIVTLRMRVQELEERDRSNRERDRKLRKRLEDFVQRAPDMQHKGVTKAKVSQAFGALADVVKEVREWVQEL